MVMPEALTGCALFPSLWKPVLLLYACFCHTCWQGLCWLKLIIWGWPYKTKLSYLGPMFALIYEIKTSCVLLLVEEWNWTLKSLQNILIRSLKSVFIIMMFLGIITLNLNQLLEFCNAVLASLNTWVIRTLREWLKEANGFLFHLLPPHSMLTLQIKTVLFSPDVGSLLKIWK